MTFAEHLEAHGIEIEKGKIICPFHDDRNPSALVNPTNIYCFSCARIFSARRTCEQLKIPVWEDTFSGRRERKYTKSAKPEKSVLFKL